MGFVSTDYAVWVNGQDVTSRFDPLLLSIKITRASGEAADECTLKLHDKDGMIILPQARAPVQVMINGSLAFDGFVSDVPYSFGKGEGRTLEVACSSIDPGSAVKEPKMKHKDDAPLSDVANEWGGAVGLAVSVVGSIASTARKYWLSQNESFMSWGQRTAKENGASFKIIGKKAMMVGLNEGISASGRPLTPINAVHGQNLLSGNISPIISRPKFKNVEVSYFDIKKGEKVKVDVPTGIQGVDAALRKVISAADEDQAKKRGEADSKGSEREHGGGSITLLGDEMAEPEANCNLSGVRPGIDGTYRISQVTLNLSKGSGFTMDLDVKQPQGAAGVDSRDSKSSAAR